MKSALKLLDSYARTYGGETVDSPIDIVFTEYDVLQPDVVFFEASRTHYLEPDEPIRVPPDLAVEVLSPSTQATDRGKKMQMFARFGVREYWIVDPVARRVEVYRLGDRVYDLVQAASDTDTARSTLLSELEFQVSALFV